MSTEKELANMEKKIELLNECDDCIYFEPRSFLSDDVSYGEVINRTLYITCKYHPMCKRMKEKNESKSN